MNDLFLSVDIETDGSIPGDHNMVSLGAVPVFCESGHSESDRTRPWVVGSEFFYKRLTLRPNTVSHKDTMKWWHQQDIRAYNEAFCEMPRSHPREAMEAFQDWATYVRDAYNADEIHLAASPIMFDGSFIRWYLEHYLQSSKPFSHRGFDIKSFWVGGHADRSYASTYDSDEFYARFAAWPPDYLKHHALDDAKYQGRVLAIMLNLRSGIGLNERFSSN